jgi:hypothetical protein
LSASTNKKIILHRFDREQLAGFVNPQTYLLDMGVELLSASGTVSVVPYPDVKSVSFVRDFNDVSEPGADRKLFHNRPKTSGIWVRMRFRDGDVMEGVLPNNLLQIEPQGFTVTPPNAAGGIQRLFVPRAALSEMTVLGVIGGPRREHMAKPQLKEQIGLFEEPR